MDEAEKVLAEAIYEAIQYHSNWSERSLQARDFKVGVSDLGFCSERTRRMLDQQQPEDSDVLAAFIGTAIGDHVEQAVEAHIPGTIRQAEVSVTLEGERNTFTLTGHPDLIFPKDGILIDAKTSYGLKLAERVGPSQQQQFQRHCYAKGAWEAGLFGDLPLEEVQVANVWVDRSAISKEVHVDMEPYDEDWVRRAGEWLDDVVYAYLNNEEARKEPPREMCAVVCGFYPVCRAHDTDVEGKIEDTEITAAVKMYREGLDLEKQGKRLKDESKAALRGIQGSTGEFLVRWVHVNESVIPEQHRSAYDKLDIRAIPKAKTKR